MHLSSTSEMLATINDTRNSNIAKGVKIKNVFDVQKEIFITSLEQCLVPSRTMSRSVKVKSNFARNKTVTLGGQLDVFFDAAGEAFIPSELSHLVAGEDIVRPGRFWIVDAPVVPVVEEVPVPVEAVSTETEATVDGDAQDQDEAVVEANEPEEVVVRETPKKSKKTK